MALQAIHGGDLNDDEVVNEYDLAILRMAYGTAGGDINGDFDTSGSDLLLWQQLSGSYSAWLRTIDLETVRDELGIQAPLPAIGDLAPYITDVIVSGSNSTHAPFSYASVAGSGAQLAAVPVGGADTITIVFSEDVNVAPGSMDLFGLLNATVPTVVDFAYNASTHAATWRFDNWWYADQYMLTLSDEVTDATGNQLDGEWVNPFAVTTTSAAVSEFPSGDGEAGGGFAFLITRLIGDANHSNVANSADYAIVLANLGMLTGATYSQGDFNGDGDGDNDDLALVIYAWNYSLESANWRRADVNWDGRVDLLDTNIISLHAGMTGAAWQDGDVNYDGQITRADLDLAFGQCGAWWDWYETAA